MILVPIFDPLPSIAVILQYLEVLKPLCPLNAYFLTANSLILSISDPVTVNPDLTPPSLPVLVLTLIPLRTGAHRYPIPVMAVPPRSIEWEVHHIRVQATADDSLEERHLFTGMMLRTGCALIYIVNLNNGSLRPLILSQVREDLMLELARQA